MQHSKRGSLLSSNVVLEARGKTWCSVGHCQFSGSFRKRFNEPLRWHMLRILIGIATLCFGVFTETDLRTQAPLQLPTLVQELQSSQKTHEAYEELVKLGKSDSNARQYLALHLPAIVEKGPQEPAQTWVNAVSLVGDLKITEASIALAKWIGVTTGDGTITLSRVAKLETSAPGKALAHIGDPAIPSLVGVLKRANLNERWNSVFALNLIGSPSAKNALRDVLKRETEPTLRSFVENSLK
jgi:hypothetical protein